MLIPIHDVTEPQARLQRVVDCLTDHVAVIRQAVDGLAIKITRTDNSATVYVGRPDPDVTDLWCPDETGHYFGQFVFDPTDQIRPITYSLAFGQSVSLGIGNLQMAARTFLEGIQRAAGV